MLSPTDLVASRRDLPCWLCNHCVRESMTIPPPLNEFNHCKEKPANRQTAAWDPICRACDAINEELFAVVRSHFDELSVDRLEFKVEARARWSTEGEEVAIENDYFLKTKGKKIPLDEWLKTPEPAANESGLSWLFLSTSTQKPSHDDYATEDESTSTSERGAVMPIPRKPVLITEALPEDLWSAAAIVLRCTHFNTSGPSIAKRLTKRMGLTDDDYARLCDTSPPMIRRSGATSYLTAPYRHYVESGDLEKKLEAEGLSTEEATAQRTSEVELLVTEVWPRTLWGAATLVLRCSRRIDSHISFRRDDAKREGLLDGEIEALSHGENAMIKQRRTNTFLTLGYSHYVDGDLEKKLEAEGLSGSMEGSDEPGLGDQVHSPTDQEESIMTVRTQPIGIKEVVAEGLLPAAVRALLVADSKIGYIPKRKFEKAGGHVEELPMLCLTDPPWLTENAAGFYLTAVSRRYLIGSLEENLRVEGLLDLMDTDGSQGSRQATAPEPPLAKASSKRDLCTLREGTLWHCQLEQGMVNMLLSSLTSNGNHVETSVHNDHVLVTFGSCQIEIPR